MENDKPKYACPHCGSEEFVSGLNSWDRYMATDDGIIWQKCERGHGDDNIHCVECDAPIPPEFQDAVR